MAMGESRPDGLPLHTDMFDYSQCPTPTFMGHAGHVSLCAFRHRDPGHVSLCAFRHRDPDFSLDPLSTNRRFQPYTELAVLGAVVVAGTTAESVQVLIPDCTVSPVGSDVVIDLRHVVELSMGAPFDMGKDLPPPDLAAALYPNSAGLLGGD